MNKGVTVITLVLACTACAVPNEITIPTFPSAPSEWHPFSTTTIPGSDCPIIEGEFQEPPSIHRIGKQAKYVSKDNTWLYSGYMPFHLAERKELPTSESSIRNNNFVIRQPDASHFYFSFLNHKETAIVEYYFKSDEGDFECRGGKIEFPRFSIYGGSEGGLVNFQIRNILLRDIAGGIVIQSTRGPYRGNLSRAKKNFSYEFFRYAPVTEVSGRE